MSVSKSQPPDNTPVPASSTPAPNPKYALTRAQLDQALQNVLQAGSYPQAGPQAYQSPMPQPYVTYTPNVPTYPASACPGDYVFGTYQSGSEDGKYVPSFVNYRKTYKVEHLGVDWDPENDNEAGYREEVDYDKANLVGSKTDLEEDGHLPVIDMDMPAHLEPSTTPGHFHLYVNKVVPWDKYVNLLNAMRDAGLVSEKYVEMSVKRGQTFVRKPGVTKQPWETGS